MSKLNNKKSAPVVTTTRAKTLTPVDRRTARAAQQAAEEAALVEQKRIRNQAMNLRAALRKARDVNRLEALKSRARALYPTLPPKVQASVAAAVKDAQQRVAPAAQRVAPTVATPVPATTPMPATPHGIEEVLSVLRIAKQARARGAVKRADSALQLALELANDIV